jgi:hypothetical protein
VKHIAQIIVQVYFLSRCKLWIGRKNFEVIGINKTKPTQPIAPQTLDFNSRYIKWSTKSTLAHRNAAHGATPQPFARFIDFTLAGPALRYGASRRDRRFVGASSAQTMSRAVTTVG